MKIKVGNRIIRFSAKDLWSQSDIARTDWPIIRGLECCQRRVMGEAGDRESRIYLVTQLDRLRVVKRNEKLFTRQDPWKAN